MPYTIAAGSWEVSDPADVLALVYDAPLSRAPERAADGADWVYSGAGYNLLVELIERVSGIGYEEFVAARLLEPAEMASSGFLTGSEPLPGAIAKSYWRCRSAGDPRRWPDDAALRGAGDLFTTARDLYRWERALRSGAVLSAESVLAYFEKRVPIQERVDYAFGWFHYTARDGVEHIEHGGDWQRGYNGVYRRYVDRDVYFFLTCNMRSADGTWLRYPIQDRVDDLLLRSKPIQLPPATSSMQPERLARYAGEFGSGPSDRVRVRIDADSIIVDARGPRAAARLLQHSEEVHRAGLATAEPTERLVESLFVDPKGSLAEALPGHPSRRALFAERWSAAAASIGDPRSIGFLAGVPGPSGTTQAVAEVVGTRGSFIVFVYWHSGSFAGLETDPEFTTLVRRFAPTSERDFIAYDIVSDERRSLRFDVGSDGRVIGLAFADMRPEEWLARVP